MWQLTYLRFCSVREIRSTRKGERLEGGIVQNISVNLGGRESRKFVFEVRFTQRALEQSYCKIFQSWSSVPARSLAGKSRPLNSYFLKKKKKWIMNMWCQEELDNHSTDFFFFFMMDTVDLWTFHNFLWHHHGFPLLSLSSTCGREQGQRKARPLQNLLHQRSFVIFIFFWCMHVG